VEVAVRAVRAAVDAVDLAADLVLDLQAQPLYFMLSLRTRRNSVSRVPSSCKLRAERQIRRVGPDSGPTSSLPQGFLVKILG
jgi:hypothetical protein